MAAIKIFYDDPYAVEFEATVVSSEPDGDFFNITTEATGFYPEGGGQPADHGTLGGARVLDVRESGGDILHVTDKPLVPGQKVVGRIDWARRVRFMQQHTGEHMVSGLIREAYGFDNVGFRMGAQITTLDVDGILPEDALKELEIRANRAVHANLRVYSAICGGAALEGLDYRSKGQITGEVRIVTVDGVDACACCGLHCAATGEVGIIKLVRAHKYKSGTRIYMLCGMDAVEDYYRKNRDMYMLGQLLSAKPDEVASAVHKLYDENVELKRRLAEYRAKELSDLSEAAVPERGRICMFQEGLGADDLRRLCMMLLKKSELAAVFSPVWGGTHRYAIAGQAAGELCESISHRFAGRGGGQKNFAQGTLEGDRAEIEGLIASFWETVGYH